MFLPASVVYSVKNACVPTFLELKIKSENEKSASAFRLHHFECKFQFILKKTSNLRSCAYRESCTGVSLGWL